MFVTFYDCCFAISRMEIYATLEEGKKSSIPTTIAVKASGKTDP